MPGGVADEDNRIFMGGIPFSMTESKVKEICEAFGRLKQFNLIKDQSNPEHNKGYAFFEYFDERAAEKAIKHLNNFEIKEKKLKVQKASQGSNQKNQITMHKNVPPEKQIPTPDQFACPSRVVQFLNMVSVHDLLNKNEMEFVKNDLI
jgi:splicing factor U2AF 65 kDa subunit